MTPEIFIECSHQKTLHISSETAISAGNHGSYFAPDMCRINAGTESYVQCRNRCEITVGSNSTVDAGIFCTIRTGTDCSVKVGPGCVVTAGDGTEIRFSWWLGDTPQITLIQIGTDGYHPYTPYQIRNGRVTALN